MKIALNGAAGRMGAMVVEAAAAVDGTSVVALVERPDHPLAGQGVSTPFGKLVVLTNPSEVPGDVDVGIDFSSPAGAVGFIEAMAERGVPVVSGTTGMGEDLLERIREAASTIPILWAPNMSLGVFSLIEAASMVRSVLGRSYDVEIVEVHHRRKKDSPSGTALALARRLAAEGGDMEVTTGRGPGETGPRPDGLIAVHPVRGGDVVGEHTVMFIGDNERIELVHRASSRKVFADGALAMAARLVERTDPGLYDVRDLLGT